MNSPEVVKENGYPELNVQSSLDVSEDDGKASAIVDNHDIEQGTGTGDGHGEDVAELSGSDFNLFELGRK